MLLEDENGPALLIIIFWSAYMKDETRLFHVIIKVYLPRKLPRSVCLLSTSDLHPYLPEYKFKFAETSQKVTS